MADGPSSSSVSAVQQQQLTTSTSSSSSSSSLPRQSRRSSSMPQSNNASAKQPQQQLAASNNRRSSLSKIIASAAVVLVERAPIKRLVGGAASSLPRSKDAAAAAASCVGAVKKDKDAKVCTVVDAGATVNDNGETALPVVVVTRGAAKKARQEDHHGTQQQQAKKRCADRYDSSESSDSGVAVSCGDCSSSSLSSLSSGGSSGGSDITEPGSPCSTTSSSDEGVAGCGHSSSSSLASSIAAARVSATSDKLAPTTQTQPPQQPPLGAHRQWPWQHQAPQLAQGLQAASGSGFKRFKAEAEPGFAPRLGDDSPRASASKGKTAAAATAGVTPATAQAADSQGKITEYFKTQIKPQPPKTKKGQQPSELTHALSKTSPEFRRPNAVHQRHTKNNNLNGKSSWESRTQLRFNGTKKPSSSTTTTTNMAKSQQQQVLPVLPIPSDVLSTLPTCKISNLRLTSEARPSDSPPPTTTSTGMDTPTSVISEDEPSVQQFKDTATTILANENNSVTTSDTSDNKSNGLDLLSSLFLPPTPSDSTKDDDEEEEESSRDSAESKPSSLSPILSAPTTIRFPAKAPSKHRNQDDSSFCRWDKCGVSCDITSTLLDHLQAAHINTQTSGDNFVCHWQGCKVQGKASCSRRWLERHVLSHGGNKPFQCIVDGCGSRFSSQTALERHVNGHFNQSETSNTTSSRKSTENGGKLVRRNGKKLRYRRQPWSARIFDYFDPGVMEGLQHRLLELTKTRTQGRLAETPGDSMVLTSQVLARRVEFDGKARVLLRWHPEDIHPDEWVLESEVQKVKHVSIRSVALAQPEELSAALYPAFNAVNEVPLQRVKQRRKPQKNT